MNILEKVPKINKTWKYLYLTLKDWGPELIEALNRGEKVKVGIKDCLVTTMEKDPLIYIEYKPDMYHKNFYNTTLPFFRGHKAFASDYPIYKDDCDTHMVTLKIPKKYHIAYEQFLKGKYSTMYSLDEIIDLYSSPVFSQYKDTLLKTPEAKYRFIEHLNKEFNSNFTHTVESEEYELPLKTEEEYFNNKSDKIYVA